jgi:hypothetical protein
VVLLCKWIFNKVYLLILKWLYFIKCTYVIKWNCTSIFKWFILEGMNHVPWSCKGKIRSWPLDLGMGKVKRHLEGERSFSNYKRMHWVLCKTQWEEEIERFMRELWGGEERAARWVHFPREIGRISQGDFLCEVAKFYCCCWRSYYTDPYSPYNKEEGTIFEVVCGHKIRGRLKCFLLLKRSYSSFHTTDYGHAFRGVVQSREAIQQYNFGTIL